MTKSVAVLGCGPSGLLVAHAAKLCGWDFRIYSKKRPSYLFGAQYLHKPIPGMTESPGKLVQYLLEGTAEDYRQKVYGDAWDGTVSPEDLWHNHLAWDIRETYLKLWAEYSNEILDVEITGMWQGSSFFRDSTGDFAPDVVVSTIPRKLWAQPQDTFHSTKVWAYGDAPEIGQECPFRPADFTVLCDGTKDVGWYRASHIFGHATIEWPERSRPPIPGVQLVEKPLGHNSTAASDFIHLGRFGAWEKGVLTTDVFDQAMNIFLEDQI